MHAGDGPINSWHANLDRHDNVLLLLCANGNSTAFADRFYDYNGDSRDGVGDLLIFFIADSQNKKGAGFEGCLGGGILCW
jgi:hypothetical protein